MARRTAWTTRQGDLLKKLWPSPLVSGCDAAEIIGRSYPHCAAKARRLGLRRPLNYSQGPVKFHGGNKARLAWIYRQEERRKAAETRK